VQIVGKVRNARFEDVRETIASRVRQALPVPIACRVVVRPLFPAVASGRRAAMFIVEVPDDASASLIASLVEALRCEQTVEYAALPADRRPFETGSE
jgi:hypothetical protein